MKPGSVVLFRFPHADQAAGKLRPALLLGGLPGPHGDVLLCMISTQLRHCTPGFDELLGPGDDDFPVSGLKAPSVIRVGRMAVAESSIIEGGIGTISASRLNRIISSLRSWLETLKNA